jgi:hypothetical protein
LKKYLLINDSAYIKNTYSISYVLEKLGYA